MADTDRLQPFRVQQFPAIPGGEQRYFTEADRRIEASIQSLIEVLKLHETRLIAGGL